MSIWGKIIGGAAGFALGGPIGALIGAVAGHAVDRIRAGAEVALLEPDEEAAQRKIAFTIGVIALAAKMAKADGLVTRDEIAAFRRTFHVPAEETANVGRFFDQARRQVAGYESYAEQVARLFRPGSPVLEDLLGSLFLIAKADGRVAEEEVEYLARVARIFGFDEAAFARIRATHLGDVEDDPYAVLGLGHRASDEEVRRTWRRLVREHHPDRLVGEGLPEEYVDTAHRRMAAINAAYDRIRKARGMAAR